MPNTDSTTTATGPQPVPVGLFLAATRPRRPGDGRLGSVNTPTPAAADLPDWNGLSSTGLAYVVRRYTRLGDVVLDLDGHPSVTAAARYLRRAPARLVASRHGPWARLVPPAAGSRPQRVVRRPGPGADLILVTLPRAGVDSADLHGITRAMSTWRRLLRPGGHLVAALAARGSEPGRISYRSTVIAAGRAAGLVYHQHIPVLLAPLPERGPRTEPERPGEADDGRRLLAGRHLPILRTVVVFAGTATGEETRRA